MLHRHRAPLFAGFAAVFVALALGAGPAGAQVTGAPQPMPSSMQQSMPSSAAMPGSAPALTAAPATAAPLTAPNAITADSFTVPGVKEDVTAANANEARDKAINEAQAKAWEQLYKRLVPTASSAPRVSATDLARLVQGFEIDSEKVSATRYVGSFTVRFRPNAVRDMMSGSGQVFVEPPAKPFVLLPVTVVDGRPVLWEVRTNWREAWEARQAGSALVPLVVPDGELPDLQAISAADALSGNPEALAAIAKRYNAGGVIVAKTELPSGGPDLSHPLTVDITRYSPDGMRDQQTVSVKPDPNDRPDDFLTRAVTYTSAAIDESWRHNNAVPSGPEQTDTVRVPLATLNDWVETRKRLSGVPAVSRADVISLSRSEAMVALTHRGDMEALRQALAARDLGLTPVMAAQPIPNPAMPSPTMPATGVPGQPGAMPMPQAGGPSAQWELRPLPRGAGAALIAPAAPAAQPAAMSVAPAGTAPMGATPMGATPMGATSSGAVAPGAPPRVLGTLPLSKAGGL